MAYIECPSCGKTALSVSSRCPHCGLLFSVGVIPPAEPSRLSRPVFMVGALVALAVVVLVVNNLTKPRVAPPRPAVAALAPAESQPEPPVVVSAPPIREEPLPQAPDAAVESSPPPAAAPRVAAPSQAAPPPSVPTGEQLRRYATTWVNVRPRRSPDAAPVRVLDPGEAMLVDSLVGGWYRVVIGGQSIGYAYGSNLSEEAP
jgi:hypothetical protein